MTQMQTYEFDKLIVGSNLNERIVLRLGRDAEVDMTVAEAQWLAERLTEHADAIEPTRRDFDQLQERIARDFARHTGGND